MFTPIRRCELSYQKVVRKFPDELKRTIVFDFESGKRDVDELNAIYQIKGHSTISRWCKLYGGSRDQKMNNNKPKKPSAESEQTLLLLSQVHMLEKELKESRLKQATLETLIDIAEQHYSIVIKKNFGGKRLSK